MYHHLVKKLVKKSFKLLNERNFAELIKPLAVDVKHTSAGGHALSGVRHSLVAFKTWLEILARVIPKLQINVVNAIAARAGTKHISLLMKSYLDTVAL